MGRRSPIDGFGDRLTRLIERLGVERQAFAAACELSNSMISGYCNDRHAPGLGPIQHGLEALRVSQGPQTLWWLSSGANPPTWLDDPGSDPFATGDEPEPPAASRGILVPYDVAYAMGKLLKSPIADMGNDEIIEASRVWAVFARSISDLDRARVAQAANHERRSLSRFEKLLRTRIGA